MAPGQRPHQPRLNRKHSSSAGQSQAPSEHGAENGTPPESGQEPGSVLVNDDSKVSDLDTSRYEEVPSGGGQFSAWRRRIQGEGPDGPHRSGHRSSHQLTAAQRRTRRRRRALWGSAGALVGALVLAWVIFFSPLLAVRSIEVQGAQLTDSQEVSQHLEQFQGVPMTRISERDVMDSLGDLPQVRSVHVMTMPNNTLVVELTERVPVAAVQDGASWALVDHEGTVLRTVEDPADLNVPVIEGGTEILGSEDFTFVADVLSTLPSALLEQVSSAQAESNSTVVLELDGGITVRWGDSSRGALKAEVLAQLVEAGAATGAVSVYDVSSPEHPVLE